MKILILGASGMLGSTLFRYFSQKPCYEVYGTLRNPASIGFFEAGLRDKLFQPLDVLDAKALQNVIQTVRPEWVINCVGLIKQDPSASERSLAIQLNALLPHQIAKLCEQYQCRLIQISTDCVFSGKKGNYLENDDSDAEDIYGKTKYLGEIPDKSHVLTFRTSIIGHELDSKRSLLEWFLFQTSKVSGYRRAIFSGLPTTEVARVLDKYVLNRSDLSGLYQLASAPISKYDLLKMIAAVYEKQIEIVPDDEVVIDRSLDMQAFMAATGYISPDWPTLIEQMYQQRMN